MTVPASFASMAVTIPVAFEPMVGPVPFASMIM